MPSLPPTVWGQVMVDGVWQDLTGIDIVSGVTVVRGRSGERSTAGPDQGTMQLINTDAKYSRRNPNSPLFGKVGLNTPCQFGVVAGSPWVEMSGTADADSYISTPSSTALDITGDVDIRIETMMEGVLDGPQLGARYGTAGNRSWRFGVTSSPPTPFFLWSPDGTNTAQAISTEVIPVAPGQRTALRAVLDVDNGLGGYTVRFYTAKSVDAEDKYWRLLGTPTETTSGTTSVFNPTQDMWVGRSGSSVMPCLNGNLYRFQLYDSNGIIADVDTSVASSGDTSFTDSQGLTWTLNGNSVMTNRHQLMYGEISSWEPDRNKSGAGSRIAIDPSGISQRINQGEKPLRSPVYRAFTDASLSGVVGYWPGEDGTTSTLVASGVGGTPMSVSGAPTFASDTSWLGSDALVSMQTGGFSVIADAYTVTGDTEFLVFLTVPSGGVSAETSLFTLTTTGSARIWNVTIKTDGDLRLLVTNTSGSTVVDTTGNFNTNGNIVIARLTMSQNGADIDWELGATFYTNVDSIFGSSSDSAVSGTLSSATVNRIYKIVVGGGGGLGDVALGHMTLLNVIGSVPAIGSAIGNSAVGWSGESAWNRFERLCREESIDGSAALPRSSPLMGSQKSMKLFDLLRQVETTENGILGESRHNAALAYRGATYMWSQEPVFTLDFSAGLIDEITPKDDTRASFNEVTANRIDGSQFVYTKETGTNSVAEIGLLDTNVDLSLYLDSDLPSHAFWRVQQATADEMRFPRIKVNFANERVFQMFDRLMAVDLGDMMRLSNVPADYGAGDFDLIVIGVSDVMSSSEWSRTFVCASGEPWNGLTVEVDGFDRIDTAGCQLTSNITEAATSVGVTTTGLYRWIDSATYASEFPFDVTVGGETMRVTACTGTTLSQTFTVVRSVNGIVKAHSAGADVRLAAPFYFPLQE